MCKNGHSIKLPLTACGNNLYICSKNGFHNNFIKHQNMCSIFLSSTYDIQKWCICRTYKKNIMVWNTDSYISSLSSEICYLFIRLWLIFTLTNTKLVPVLPCTLPIKLVEKYLLFGYHAFYVVDRAITNLLISSVDYVMPSL
jgi:hypothetical protein